MKYRIREEAPRSEKVIIKVSKAEHMVIKMLAAQEDMSMTRFIVRALRFYLKNKYGVHQEKLSNE